MTASPARISPFWCGLTLVTGLYLAFLLALLGATATYTTPGQLWAALDSQEIRYSIGLSLVSCTTSALLAVLLAVPVGYLLSRGHFAGNSLLATLLDIPIVLPPMVVGLCLLIFFRTPAGQMIERIIPFTYTAAGVVLAQFVIGAAFAIRTMKGVFDHLSSRPEDVAMTLGCSRGQAVWLVTLPAARRGVFAAFSIAWARGLGRIRPHSGLRRRHAHFKTEVLPTSIFTRTQRRPLGNSGGGECVDGRVGVGGPYRAVRLAGEKL